MCFMLVGAREVVTFEAKQGNKNMLVGIVEAFIQLHLSEIHACNLNPTEPVAQNETAADGF